MSCWDLLGVPEGSDIYTIKKAYQYQKKTVRKMMLKGIKNLERHIIRQKSLLRRNQ